MTKAANRYFVAGDYDLTLRLRELFHETVSLQAKLDSAGLKAERVELASKLKATHKEINLLVREMKHLLSDTEAVTNPASLTLSASKRSS